jgi:hypothetical protein
LSFDFLFLVAARLTLQTDQHIFGAAEILQRRFAEAETVECRPHRGEIRRARAAAHFD